ncbi:hypothetical protein FJV41_11370 [Myxococcus llanfairpwllgwyngyllgogerychwyrndrobwllllantysiliogogogochensis]|uniref:Uncharacterized protein n=1 Tax=Myxococcus llanfairpwllgwyngyllgogerychwyrndrobwllllantysiliogogogochensis TaxID=2590453 RepID=A0A540X3M4_9BACT|nr:hypothetical protein [Myxococcus llanfairpwllgwyngyllgogerychwyrndrobwllllantysiliogogogochensis]TQF15846.1 hypothetical protein FJV41_11370 [Myxococcus llanfairpwllgwyngyllgogerychwyrndrobwllllantysiliogogogochensis]
MFQPNPRVLSMIAPFSRLASLHLEQLTRPLCDASVTRTPPRHGRAHEHTASMDDVDASLKRPGHAHEHTASRDDVGASLTRPGHADEHTASLDDVDASLPRPDRSAGSRRLGRATVTVLRGTP